MFSIDCRLCSPVRLPALAEYAKAPVPIMTEWGERLTPETAWRGYPRPQMVRKGWTNLNGFVGSVYTQTTDVEDEYNSLMSYDRKVVKFDIDAVAQANRRILDMDEK